MAQFTVAHDYDHDVEQVWEIFADIGNVQEISPGVQASKRLNKKQGVGAVRSCDFGKGAGIHEEVTAWEEGKQIQFTGTKIWGMPMKSMVATFDFEPTQTGSRVSMTMQYEMKFGLLMNPVAKLKLKPGLRGMLVGADQKL